MPNKNNKVYTDYIINKKKFYKQVQKRLMKSMYPMQANDFYFVPMPSNQDKINANKDLPVDWQLTNLLLYLWEKDLVTNGLDQGFEARRDGESFYLPVFIFFRYRTIGGKLSEPLIKKLFSPVFKSSNIVVFDDSALNIKNPAEHFANRREEIMLVLKNPAKLVVHKYNDSFRILFRNARLDDVHNKFKIDLPSHALAYPGGLVERDAKTGKYKQVNVNTMFESL